jgi:hypothetical protein
VACGQSLVPRSRRCCLTGSINCMDSNSLEVLQPSVVFSACACMEVGDID